MKEVSRRDFLQAGAVMMAAASAHAQSGGQPNRENRELSRVKALVFDVFGTVVDWRTSVTAEVQDLAKRKGVAVDAAKFADAWRAAYGPSMNRPPSPSMSSYAWWEVHPCEESAQRRFSVSPFLRVNPFPPSPPLPRLASIAAIARTCW